MKSARGSSFSSARSGVTLIELLIVLAIVGVLVGMSLAGFYRFREVAFEVERSEWLNQRKMGEVGPRKKPIRILFIGNSYTSANDLPGMLQNLVRGGQKQPDLTYEEQIAGGATWEVHWGMQTALKKIKQPGWDFIVLQEQSQRPVFDPNGSLQYGSLFLKEINQLEGVQPIPVMYLTWAREAIPEQQESLNSIYYSLAKRNRAEVAPVGLAFEKCRRESPQLKLFVEDGSHPSPMGTYLAACTFYATIYQQSPVGLPASVQAGEGTNVQLTPEEATLLQTYAWEALKDVHKAVVPIWKQ